jgi:hypothetical protein
MHEEFTEKTKGKRATAAILKVSGTKDDALAGKIAWSE